MVVGVWGLELQRHILENQGIPTALVNGGVGGSRIEQNLRNGANSENLATIYGRTLYRVRRAGLDSSVRALYWYQGESNTDAGYYDNFRGLYQSWLEDYPSLEQIYVVQIRPGCALGNRHSELRELLRTLPDSFRNDPVPIVAYAPTAAPGHDGCHYALSGYLVIGQQLYDLTARDLYGSTDTMNIESPTVLRARYGTKDRQTIVLDFGPSGTDLIWQGGLIVGESLRLLRDAFALDTLEEQVIAGSARGNRVTLFLAEPSNATTISYVPEDYYPGTTTVYQGPWLMNARGVGAFSFAGVPISEYDPSSVRNTLLPDESITARWRRDEAGD